MEQWWHYLLLAGVGLISGTLNVVAGGGSFLTLPVLIFLGLPAGVANGTNRVGIVLQNVSASWGFWRAGVLEPRALLWSAVPATLGAAIGTSLALTISDRAFERVLATLMVGLTLWTLLGRDRLPRDRPFHRGLLALGFFLVGIYGGFVQAGVGFLILAVTSLAGYDLVKGNAVKVVSVLCFSSLSLLLFAIGGRVAWLPGLALAVGTMIGAAIGVRLTVLKGHRWIQRVVTITVIVFAIRLWWG